MEKKCDCECHKSGGALQALPCNFCMSAHYQEPRELAPFEEVHDGNTEVTNLPGWRPPEGFPF